MKVFVVLLLLPGWALAAEPVPYVKTMVIGKGHPLYEALGAIHHLYANKRALAGYRSGKFPPGSVIVFDLLEVKTGGNALQEGARKVLGVMHRDPKRWPDTGGWGFEGFKGDSKTERAVGAKAAAACFQCHTSQKDEDFVFSTYRR